MKRCLLLLFGALLPLALVTLVLSAASGVAAQTLTESTPAAPAAIAAPSIALAVTVGTNPAICAATESVTLPAGGGMAIYCYEVTNTGDVTLNRHTLVDTESGTILNDFHYSLVPGASAFLTHSVMVTVTTASTATWTAYNPGPTSEVHASGSALVEVPVPSIAMSMTVGTNPAVCATTGSLELPAPGGAVTYCYEVTNTGDVTLTRHTLTDSALGSILDGLHFTLAPGASAFLTQSATITSTTLSTATWLAFNSGPVNQTSAEDSVTVVVRTQLYFPALRRD